MLINNFRAYLFCHRIVNALLMSLKNLMDENHSIDRVRNENF